MRTGGDASSWVTAIGDMVFVSNTSSNSVTRIDAQRRTAIGTTKVGGSPVNLDAVGGEVWVPCDQGHRVDHLGADGKLLETIDTGANPAVVAGVNGEVWVTVFDAGTVWRLTPG